MLPIVTRWAFDVWPPKSVWWKLSCQSTIAQWDTSASIDVLDRIDLASFVPSVLVTHPSLPPFLRPLPRLLPSPPYRLSLPSSLLPLFLHPPLRPFLPLPLACAYACFCLLQPWYHNSTATTTVGVRSQPVPPARDCAGWPYH